MADLLDKTQTTSVSQTDSAIYVVNARTTSPVDRWETPGDFHKNRTGNDSVLSYATLSAAITAIGATQSTIEIPATTTVSASLTIPANVTLLFLGAGMISVSSGQTLTVNGPIQAPLRQVFTGVGSVRFGIHIEKAYVQWFGAVLDNLTDDTAAIQKAIDAFQRTSKPHAGGVVILTGGAVITSSLTIHETSVTLRGMGWGVTSEAPFRGFLRWDGSAGSPMIFISDCYNSGVETLRLIGKSTAKPTAAIEYKRTAAAVVQADNNYADRVWIGPYFGYDSDIAIQFDAGIIFTGTIDNDTNHFREVVINRCSIGVDIQNPNSSVTYFDTLSVTDCPVGFKSNAFVSGHNWNFGNNDVDIQVVNGKSVTVHDFTSESSEMIAVVEANAYFQLDIFGIQVTDNIPANRIIIDGGGSGIGDNFISLRQGRFTDARSSTTNPWLIRQRNTGGASREFLEIDRCLGIDPNNLDVQTVGEGTSAQHCIVFNRPTGGPYDWGERSVVYLTDGEAYEAARQDFLGRANIFGGPFMVRALGTPTGVVVTPTGSGATTYGYRVSAISATGETLAAASVTCVNNATLSGSAFNVVTCDPVRGATGYKFYGRTNGSELLMATVSAADVNTALNAGHNIPYFKDDGSLTPSGALPAVNSTGGASVAGTMQVGTFTSTERDALTAANGMVIYNSTTSKLQARAGGAWVDLH